MGRTERRKFDEGYPRTESGLQEAGFHFEGTSHCKYGGCGAEIAWYRTPKGKVIPLDEGTLEPHWSTCVSVKALRRRRQEARQ